MKNLTRLLLIPVLFAQLTTFSPKANAKEMEWWQAALIGGVAGAVVYAVLSNQDEESMNLGMRGAFRGNITIGDRVPWQGDNHKGYYEYESQGHSRDGQYSNCRRVRPVAYDRNDRPVDMRRYPPTCACQTADNRWKKIPLDQYVEGKKPYGPYRPTDQNYHYMTADNTYTNPNPVYTEPTYNNDSPYSPFYSGRPLRNYNGNPPQYPQPPYYPQQPDYSNGLDFGLHMGLTVEI